MSSSDPGARVTAVVVTWNAAAHVAESLTTLPDDIAVIVVDNASEDGTVAEIQRVTPRAEVVRNQRNVGFAAAVNQALRMDLKGDLVLLLNPDATVDRASLVRLIEECDAHSDIAAASAAVVDTEGHHERYAGGREPSLSTVAVHELGLSRLLPGRGLYDRRAVQQTRDLDWVAGTCVLLSRRAIEDFGPLDERYFLYAEDIDWCRRAREHGWRVVVVSGAIAVHEGSRSVRTAGAWVDAHRIGSLDLYYGGRHGAASLLAFRFLRGFGAGLRAVGYAITAPGRPERRALARQRWIDARLALRPRRAT